MSDDFNKIWKLLKPSGGGFSSEQICELETPSDEELEEHTKLSNRNLNATDIPLVKFVAEIIDRNGAEEAKSLLAISQAAFDELVSWCCSVVMRNQNDLECARAFELILDTLDHDDSRLRNGLFVLATVYLEAKQFRHSKAMFERCLSLPTTTLEWRTNCLRLLGEVLAFLGQTDEAVSSCVEALDNSRPGSEDYAHSLRALADVHISAKRNNEALQLLTEAIRIFDNIGLSPDLVHCYNVSGSLLWGLGRVSEAERDFELAISVCNMIEIRDYRLATVLNNRAIAIECQRRFEESEEDLRLAIKILKRDPMRESQLGACQSNLGRLLVLMGQFDDAEEHLRVAVTTLLASGALSELAVARENLQRLHGMMSSSADSIAKIALEPILLNSRFAA